MKAGHTWFSAACAAFCCNHNASENKTHTKIISHYYWRYSPILRDLHRMPGPSRPTHLCSGPYSRLELQICDLSSAAIGWLLLFVCLCTAPTGAKCCLVGSLGC